MGALGRHSTHKAQECGTINDGSVPEERLNTCKGLAALLNWRRPGQSEEWLERIGGAKKYVD